MEILVNGIAKIKADLSLEENNYILRKEVIGSEEKDAFHDLFSGKGPIILNDGEKDIKVKRVSYLSSNTGGSDVYQASVTFRDYTEEDEKEDNTPGMNTILLMENYRNRLRIEGLQKILLDKGVVDSDEDYFFENLFTDEEFQSKIDKYQKELRESYDF